MNVTQPLQDLAVIQFQIKPELQAQEGTLMHTCFCGFIYNTIRTSKTSTPDRYEVILLICLDYMYMHIECTAYVLVLVIFVSLYYTHILTFSLFLFCTSLCLLVCQFSFPSSLFLFVSSPFLSLSLSLSRTNHPQSVSDSAATGGAFKPHIDQSRPSAKDEEELQLQLALRMSKEQAEEEEKLR